VGVWEMCSGGSKGRADMRGEAGIWKTHGDSGVSTARSGRVRWE
jgi:hypothetical protein